MYADQWLHMREDDTQRLGMYDPVSRFEMRFGGVALSLHWQGGGREASHNTVTCVRGFGNRSPF